MGASLSLASLYEGWDEFNAEIVSTIKPLSPEQLELRVNAEQRTAGAILKHMVEARGFWFRVVLGIDEPAFRFHHGWGDDDEPISASELANGLDVTFRGILAQLDQWTLESFAEEFLSTPGTSASGRASFSPRWVTWHVLEHDLVHGGELFLTLGTNHLAVPDW